MDWPPTGGAGGQPPTSEGFPPANWPSKAQLEYVRTLVIVLLLLLAVPWLAAKIVTAPGELFAGAGKRVVSQGPVMA